MRRRHNMLSLAGQPGLPEAGQDIQMQAPCCQQVVVSRDVLMRRPHSFYTDLDNLIFEQLCNVTWASEEQRDAIYRTLHGTDQMQNLHNHVNLTGMNYTAIRARRGPGTMPWLSSVAIAGALEHLNHVLVGQKPLIW